MESQLEVNLRTVFVLGERKVIDERDGDQAKESDILKDDGQISAGKLEADMKTGIGSCTVGERKVIDESEDNQAKDNGQISAGELEADMKTGADERERDQAKENDGSKDNGQISAGELDAGMKADIDSAQLTPETVTLSEGESPKVDIEPSGRKCFKELMELGKGAETARSLDVS